ncbi:Ionotropic receptor 25a [Amphibalanus amphitrite]|uniref:Ionotropic receptor 25a n=1 Tax=Amphibalanus amphitrite TaxID=1232801 RepID=A0A6A4XEY9_AMPAM|nr:Ionotropic receptor 25a [Amphibalanus amphitrite]
MEKFGGLLSVGKPWAIEDPDQVVGPNATAELIVTTVHDPPYMVVDRHADGSSSCSGYLYDLWSIMASALNIRFRMVPLLSGDFGALRNGTWSGMIGELAYGRADVAVTTLDITPSRATVVDFLDTFPVNSVTYRFYVRAGEGETLSLTGNLFKALLKPLHAHVWWTILASLLVLSLILWVIQKEGSSKGKKRLGKRESDWPSCLFLCFMTAAGQGWTTTPTSLSGRIITICCWMLGIIITAGYTANLISYLTTGGVNAPIVSLKHFSEEPEWKLSVPVVTSNERVRSAANTANKDLALN